MRQRNTKVIPLIIFSFFLAALPNAKAEAAGEVDIASVSACSVSLKNIWEPFGAPHPCFTDGSQLKVMVPSQRNVNVTIEINLNGEIFNSTAGTYFSIPRYALGLNNISIIAINGLTQEKSEISRLNFIIYTAPISFRMRTLSLTKSAYVIRAIEGISYEVIISSLGISNSEFVLKNTKGSNLSSGPSILVADLSNEQYAIAASSPLIANVYKEGIAYVESVQNGATWGLDRIDQFSNTLDGNYSYSQTGQGVDIYVIDSGIIETHTEFIGRIGDGAYLQNLGSTYDCHGHGTHVAGTAAGTTYGVAKSARIIPVRVFGCSGSGSYSDIESAIAWVISDHLSTAPAVANLSIGGPFDSGLNDSIQALIDDGVVTVVAAGNDGGDACNYSPSSSPNAITVGATTSTDQDATFSNIGSCVDIFAPGLQITSAGNTSSTAVSIKDGTSMAAPHVAGAAALVLEKNFSSYSDKLQANARVRSTLLSNALPGVLRDSNGFNLWWNNFPGAWWTNTPNYLLNTSFFSEQSQSSLSITNNVFLFNKGENIQLTSAGGSGAGVTYYKAKGYGCSISGSTLVISIKRVCVVSAYKTGDSTYTITQSPYSYFTTEQPQAAFSISNGVTSGNIASPIPLTTIGGSGSGAVSYAIGSGPCRVMNGKLLAYGVGECQITATKAADDTYLPKTSETKTFAISTALTHGPWKKVSVGEWFTCAITKSDESLYCWGINDNGQLARPVNVGNTTAPNSTPLKVTGIPGRIKEVSLGGAHACAVNSEANLYCWGANNWGQLGIDTTTNSSKPETVTALLGNVKSVSSGVVSVCALTLTGAVYCWGQNTFGALGNGSTNNSKVPVPVNGLGSGVSQISSGYFHVCALQSGAAKCWGYGGAGGLGVGSTESSTVPINVSNLSSGVTKISAGFDHTCALQGANTFCWGGNSTGSVGDGSSTNRNLPVQLGDSVSALTDINAGGSTTCGISQSSNLLCWGFNNHWQVGNNSETTTSQLLPSVVNGMTNNVVNAESSLFNTCAITRYGRMFCWGDNSAGQIGSGDTETTRTAYEVNQLDYSLNAPLTPLITETPTARSASSYKLQISNFDSSYGWSALSSPETAVAFVDASGIISVSGLAPLESSTITVTSIKSGFETGTATSFTVATLALGRTPRFDTSTVVSTADGFKINIANYDSNYSWIASSSRDSATATINETGTVTVTGIAPGTLSTVTVSASRTGYSTESATSLSYNSLTGAGLLPVLDSSTAIATGDGFVMSIANYDPAYTWSATSTINGASAIVSNAGLITVTGVSSSTASQVIVTTSRTGYFSRSETSSAVTSLPAGLTPIFETSTATSDGFTILISNYSNLYTWSATSSRSGGAVSISTSGVLTVSNVPAGTSTTVTVTTSRSGYGTVSATSPSISSISPPPPPAPSAPAPSVGGGGGGGVGTTWFNLFVSNPNDPALAFAGEACALFTLKSSEGDKQFGPICATKAGSLDFEANDGEYLIRTFDKAFPKYYKEYKAKVTFGTFEVVGAGYRGGSVPRRVITVLKSSEFPVEQVVTPTPSSEPSSTPTPIPTPEVISAATPTPTPTSSPSTVTTMANNGLVSTVAKSSATKKVTLTAGTTSLTVKKNGSLALSVSKIPAKSSLTVTVTLPTGEKIIAASIKSYIKSSYSMPALAFNKSGNYLVMFKIGKSTKTVKIKVS